MYKINISEDKNENYILLHETIKTQLMDETDLIANLANISSFIYASLPGVNWAGFYLLKGDTLILGPFCGKPACTRIPMGKGVCGIAAKNKEIIVVPNVHEFEGHIACDWDTNSEIVLPIYRDGEIFGVLDIDSYTIGYFTDDDKEALSKIANSISEFVDKIKCTDG